MSADPISTIRVRKRDGSLAPYDGNEVAASIMDSARGLDDAVARATLLQAEVEITLFDGMTTDALDEAVIQVRTIRPLTLSPAGSPSRSSTKRSLATPMTI